MSIENTTQQLRVLKYKGMLEEFEAQATSTEYDHMSFMERFALIVEAEYLRRKNSRVALRHRQAGFAQRDACIEGINYSCERNISKDTMLTLASCSYIKRQENILILGASDSGKTYLSCALGNAACRRDIKVSYHRLTDLFAILELAEETGKLIRTFRHLATVPVLVIDDFLLSVPTLKQVQMLVELTEQRERTASTIICSQLNPRDWHKRIDEAIQANCIYSRLVPSAHMIELKGKTPMREHYSTIGKAIEE
jgi:DNA replication protein DnaC